ncbi:MAG TPA: ankyrin repeat domain-containing protein [Urbifossiella sp.]|nr:ankyrin repeat domain-containing protein [Urbifossiella sp.]
MDEALAYQKRIREAIKAGDCETAKALIDADPSQLHTMTVFGTWMHVAAARDQVDLVEWLVRRGADVNARGGIAGATPIHDAASEGHTRVTEYLLSVGAVMETYEPHVNPLFAAVHGGHRDVVRLLLDRGIDATVRYTGENMKDRDAVAHARLWGQTEIADTITAHHERSESRSDRKGQ